MLAHDLQLGTTVRESILVSIVCGFVQMQAPRSLLQYFSQIRPLSDCDAEDGRIIGQLLLDVVDDKPEHLAHAIRNFVNRTSMLRECGCRHIGHMLVELICPILSPSAEDASVESIVESVQVGNLAALAEGQAAAIGRLLSSRIRSAHSSSAVAATVVKVVRSIAPLHQMASTYDWFVPMLETIAQSKAKSGKRQSLLQHVTASSAVVPSALEGGESSFDPICSQPVRILETQPALRIYHGALHASSLVRLCVLF